MGRRLLERRSAKSLRKPVLRRIFDLCNRKLGGASWEIAQSRSPNRLERVAGSSIIAPRLNNSAHRPWRAISARSIPDRWARRGTPANIFQPGPPGRPLHVLMACTQAAGCSGPEKSPILPRRQLAKPSARLARARQGGGFEQATHDPGWPVSGGHFRRSRFGRSTGQRCAGHRRQRQAAR
jgi:hypothetical protein